MAKRIVKNCVLFNGRYYQAGEEINIDKTTEVHLDKSGALEGKGTILTAPPNDSEDFVNPFTEIELEDKFAKILVNAGIPDLDTLGGQSVEDLSAIKGISKSKAQEIFESFDEEEEAG